ncbi:hypothetical protein RHSIM_Rhsim13G0215000 [Rhododendron simsii]|uniref:Uncharacterized protein n=1 Tax=Rhododendron simsii TaxID=118357 RepID=A0A834G176_RHOSS|nr:hypothetical protein RHSIM_Rhsim13G0214800 [Rhododendron simsii]KAF7121070.1 hypothetical protein RHSIM_Rhsim13G0215000 [Rhododendron simsii]
MSENGQGNGSGLLVDVQSLSRQLAQVLSNPEDEAAQELITLMRRVVIPPSTIDVDANGVVHEQVRYSDMPKQAPPQDLIQKGLLQYAKGEKDPMSIESDPFPKVEINMVNANLAKRLGSTVVRQKQGEGDRMETDEESAKSQPLRFPNDYLCIRCGREIKYGEAIIAEKEQKCAFSKSGLRFNTMGGNDLQIYVGAKLIYEGIDPGLFNRIESEHCYGPDDGPFLFRGHPVVPARPGVPSSQELEAVGYQFPSRGRYSNYRGAGPRRGMGPRGRGPYGYGGHQPRMVMPPNNDHENWSTLSHPKFPAEGWYTKVSTSQKRRLQRKFAARMYNDPWDHVFEHKEKVEPHKVPNMVWTRGQEGTSSQKQNVSEHEVQDTTAASSKSIILPKGRKELKQSLKKKMEEFQKLMEADDDDLLDEESEQEDLIKDATPSPQKSATFGESLAAIQFGSVPINYQCHMILVLPKHFKAKPDQPMELADQHPFQAETNNVEADLYKEHLWPMKIEDTEVKSNGIGVTESQFLTYIKEGFRELSKDFVRPNVIARPVVDKKLQACEPISCNWAECVFDDSPLTMKDLGLADLKPAPAKLDDDRAQVKDPTEEVNLGTQEDPKITYVNATLPDEIKEKFKFG